MYKLKGGLGMRIKAILSLSAVVLALFAGAVQATLITRDVVIDLETDGILFIQCWNDHDQYNGGFNIEDTSFNTGDTLLLNMQFANSQRMEFSNPGTNQLNSGIETMDFRIFMETPNQANYRASGFFTYVGVDGDLLNNPTYWDSWNDGATVFQARSFPDMNLTDTSFSFSGISIEINFDPLDNYGNVTTADGGSWGVFNRVEWTTAAEEIRIVDAVPIPEPATILLMVSGLVGLAGFRKKFKKR